MIVDCHCHAGRGDGLTGPWNTRAPLRDFLRRARVAGIGRVNLLTTFSSDYAAGNRRVRQYKMMRASLTRYGGTALLRLTQ